MVVPYGDPHEPHYRKNAFDAGEDGLGKNAHSLKKVRGCVGKEREAMEGGRAGEECTLSQEGAWLCGQGERSNGGRTGWGRMHTLSRRREKQWREDGLGKNAHSLKKVSAFGAGGSGAGAAAAAAAVAAAGGATGVASV
ncbi:unnamed protein product [Closterium sp. NIES-54]